MIIRIFSVYDKAAEAWLPPFFLPMQGMATRAFSDCVNKEGHNFNAHPTDYTLAEIGTFDDSNGHIKSHLTPVILVTGLQAKKQGLFSEVESDTTGTSSDE